MPAPANGRPRQKPRQGNTSGLRSDFRDCAHLALRWEKTINAKSQTRCIRRPGRRHAFRRGGRDGRGWGLRRGQRTAVPRPHLLLQPRLPRQPEQRRAQPLQAQERAQRLPRGNHPGPAPPVRLRLHAGQPRLRPRRPCHARPATGQRRRPHRHRQPAGRRRRPSRPSLRQGRRRPQATPRRNPPEVRPDHHQRAGVRRQQQPHAGRHGLRPAAGGPLVRRAAARGRALHRRLRPRRIQGPRRHQHRLRTPRRLSGAPRRGRLPRRSMAGHGAAATVALRLALRRHLAAGLFRRQPSPAAGRGARAAGRPRRLPHPRQRPEPLRPHRHPGQLPGPGLRTGAAAHHPGLPACPRRAAVRLHGLRRRALQRVHGTGQLGGLLRLQRTGRAFLAITL